MTNNWSIHCPRLSQPMLIIWSIIFLLSLAFLAGCGKLQSDNYNVLSTERYTLGHRYKHFEPVSARLAIWQEAGKDTEVLDIEGELEAEATRSLILDMLSSVIDQSTQIGRLKVYAESGKTYYFRFMRPGLSSTLEEVFLWSLRSVGTVKGVKVYPIKGPSGEAKFGTE